MRAERKIGLLMLFLIVAFSSSAVFLCGDTSYEKLSIPSMTHLFGTDREGFDLAYMTGKGFFISFFIASSSTLLSLLLSFLVVYFHHGKHFAFFFDVLSSSLKSVPPLLLALFFISLSNGGMPSLILSLSLSRIPSLSQIGISGVRSLEREEFVLSSRSIGMPWHMLFFRHMARYVAPSMANQGILVFFSTILAESSLSFLGFSAYGSSPSLGLLIRKGMEYALSYPHLMAFPSLVLFFFLLSVFLVWDGGRVVDSSAH